MIKNKSYETSIKSLSKLKLKFGENILAETNKYELLITDAKDLSGLPEGEKEAAKHLAESKNKKGWLFTLDYPSYIPFMKYADNRKFRKKLSLRLAVKVLKMIHWTIKRMFWKLSKLRYERANLLGYKTHAHFVLEERMAKTPEKVTEFLKRIIEKS